MSKETSALRGSRRKASRDRLKARIAELESQVSSQAEAIRNPPTDLTLLRDAEKKGFISAFSVSAKPDLFRDMYGVVRACGGQNGREVSIKSGWRSGLGALEYETTGFDPNETLIRHLLENAVPRAKYDRLEDADKKLGKAYAERDSLEEKTDDLKDEIAELQDTVESLKAKLAREGLTSFRTSILEGINKALSVENESLKVKLRVADGSTAIANRMLKTVSAYYSGDLSGLSYNDVEDAKAAGWIAQHYAAP